MVISTCFLFSSTGFSISVVEEDGVQQLYITDVKAGGLAFAKGSSHFISCQKEVSPNPPKFFQINQKEKDGSH